MKLKDKIAIVTGASSGMGRSIAEEYAKEGAIVYAVARRAERLEELVKNTANVEGEIRALAHDLMDKEACDKMVDEVVADAGRVDILVNNAGIMDDFSPAGDFTDEMLEKVFQINTFAPFYTTRRVLKEFKKQGGGIIVNIASIGGLFGTRAGAVYTASKHAVVGLTRNTGYMYAKENIRCNGIAPGAIETEIGSGTFMQHANQEAMALIMPTMASNPAQGKPKDVARVAVFLASEDAGMINGQIVTVDGGWTAL